MMDHAFVPGAIVIIHNPFYPQDTNGIVMSAPDDNSWATVLILDGEKAGTHRAFPGHDLEVVGHVPRYSSERQDVWIRGKRIAWRNRK